MSGNHFGTKVIEGYSSSPLIYDIRGFFILKLAYQGGLFRQILFFGSNMGKEHLDVAVGTGTLLYLILLYKKVTRQHFVSHIHVIDYTPRMLEGAVSRFKGYRNVKLAVEDASALSFQDNTFDTVNIANALHCFSEIDKAITEAFRVTKPGGTFAVNVLLHPEGNTVRQKIARRINAWGIKKGILYSPYHKEEICSKIRNAGFLVTEELTTRNCFYLKARK